MLIADQSLVLTVLMVVQAERPPLNRRGIHNRVTSRRSRRFTHEFLFAVFAKISTLSVALSERSFSSSGNLDPLRIR